MRDPEDTDFQSIPAENEELVHRLRELRWPTVRPEVRERCWAAFNLRLSEGLVAVEERPAGRRNAGSRLDYSRRKATGHVPPALVTSGRRSWTARPTRRLTAFVV
jgi:hypothetical protein